MSGGFSYDPTSGACYRSLAFLGFPNYRVGDDGTVWSCQGRRADGWYELKYDPGKLGHLRVTLCPGSKRFLVHHLVLLAFVGQCPPGMECRHFPDPNPANNAVTNISWTTRLVNQRDRFAHGTSNRGEGHGRASIAESDVRQIRAEHATGNLTLKQLGLKYGLTISTIYDICAGRSWKHVV